MYFDSEPDPLVKWLRHRPFTAVTWVQIPYGSLWRISSAGRASALQAGGHRFEPCILHRSMATEHAVAFFIINIIYKNIERRVKKSVQVLRGSFNGDAL